MGEIVEDWHGKATSGINQPNKWLYKGMKDNQYTAGTHVDRLVEKTLTGNKIMVSRAVGGEVALTIGFGDDGETVTMFVKPARARQIAASLLNKADASEGVR